MESARKKEVIEELHEVFNTNPHVIMTQFSKIGVNDTRTLRRQLKDVGGQYKVLKNRLAKRAAQGTGAEELSEQFSGPVGIAYHPEDPVCIAKTLTDFAKEHPGLELVAGVIDGKELIDPQGVKHLSSLPSLPELQAKLLSLFNTPGTQLVRLLNTPGGQIARAIDAKREQMDG